MEQPEPTYGRYPSFRAWMVTTLWHNMLLLLPITMALGLYDSLGVPIGIWLQHWFTYSI